MDAHTVAEDMRETRVYCTEMFCELAEKLNALQSELALRGDTLGTVVVDRIVANTIVAGRQLLVGAEHVGVSLVAEEAGGRVIVAGADGQSLVALDPAGEYAQIVMRDNRGNAQFAGVASNG